MTTPRPDSLIAPPSGYADWLAEFELSFVQAVLAQFVQQPVGR